MKKSQPKRADFRAFMEAANAEDRAKRTGAPISKRKRIKVRGAVLPPHPAHATNRAP